MWGARERRRREEGTRGGNAGRREEGTRGGARRESARKAGGREGRLTCRLSGAAVAGLILILILVRNSFKIGTTEDISCRIGGNNVVP